MNIFQEYLDDWEELDPRWRPVIERLAERAGRGGSEGEQLDECAVWAVWSRKEGADAWMGKPMLIWCDVHRPTGGGEVSLGALFQESSISCGSLNGHCPDDLRGADLSWASYEAVEGESIEVLGDFFADWFLEQMRAPVEALEKRRSAPARATAAEPARRRWVGMRSRRAG